MPSTLCGGSSPRDSSRVSRASCAMSDLPRSWHRTHLSRPWSNGLSQAFRITRAPGSWRPPNIAPSIDCAETNGSTASAKSSDASWRLRRRWRRRFRLVAVTSATISFVSSSSRVAQWIVRAKRTLTAAHVPFEVPMGSDLEARLGAVLEVIYLVFNEGYSATAGDDWMRPALCLDALRLGRLVAELLPREPEAHGLVALMEIQASRTNARVGPGGEPILLLDQNRGQWDQLLIRRGLAALARAEALGGALGPYALQAAIAACHARARAAAETDWAQIAALYDALAQIAHSPVVELNRAVAYAMAFGPAAGLELADALVTEPSLKSYHLLPSVRGDLLAKLGRSDEARSDFERAAALTRNERERDLLLQRAAACSL